MADKKQFVVFGLGRFGSNLAIALADMGYNVLGVDRDENIASSMANRLTHVVSFDIRDARAMEQAGIASFDAAIIASGNLEASLMATMLCKEMNLSEIIVKAIDERHAEMARRLGATEVIFSERDTARRVAFRLVSPHMVDYIEIAKDIQIMGVDMPRRLVGKNLIESELRSLYQLNLIALIHEGKTIVSPSPNQVFAADDRMFLIGTPETFARFEREMMD
ncbi:MAG: TrkA family potassium uptake protein [Selenomonadaceae bacterium]|nr:TrkA family potassium uptake protein [Selenomonadaceae bacterium]